MSEPDQTKNIRAIFTRPNNHLDTRLYTREMRPGVQEPKRGNLRVQTTLSILIQEQMIRRKVKDNSRNTKIKQKTICSHSAAFSTASNSKTGTNNEQEN